MGYRELLKKYIRFVEAHAGDHFIGAIPYVADPPFSDRELGELRTLVSELSRTSGSEVSGRMPNFNYQLRLLCICYGLTLHQAATLGGVDVPTVRRWRTDPLSRHYEKMPAGDFARFEDALCHWLQSRRGEIKPPMTVEVSD